MEVHPALRRALAVYEYDPAGRITSLAHYWQNYSSGYSSTPILRQDYAYDSVKRLRAATSFYDNPDSDGDFDFIRTETYDYDDDLDYLTEVDYNDGLPSEAQTWTYDAAGNRATDSVQGSGWSYDHLNRMSASPGYSYLHDILGNRTWRNFGASGVQRYQWDVLNRATSIVGEAYGARYVYRADGMRVEKVEGLTISWVPPGEEEVSGHYDDNLAQNLPTTRYYYDGQMMVEDDYTVESQQYEPVVTVMRYGIGARGIDFMEKRVDDGPATKGYPIYDGHGNMIATLGHTQNSPYYGLSDLRSYDVWGSVRSGSTTGDPKQRYCANLGHVQDDESGLIYMRARYYEPWTGRFVSQDVQMNGHNWYVYCSNDPVGRSDPTGNQDEWTRAAVVFGALVALGGLKGIYSFSNLSRPMIISGLAFLAAWAGSEFLRAEPPMDDGELGYFIVASAIFMTLSTVATVDFFPRMQTSVFQEAWGVIQAYAFILGLFMAIEYLES